MAKPGAYQEIIVETFYPSCTSGLHGAIHVRPLPDQGLDTHLMVECSKSLAEDYPVGSLFKIRAKVTDRMGSGAFIYSYHGWEALLVTGDEAARHIRNNAPWSW
jgi:hypothetical protein